VILDNCNSSIFFQEGKFQFYTYFWHLKAYMSLSQHCQQKDHPPTFASPPSTAASLLAHTLKYQDLGDVLK